MVTALTWQMKNSEPNFQVKFGINFSKIEHLWPSSFKCMVSHHPCPFGRILKLLLSKSLDNKAASQFLKAGPQFLKNDLCCYISLNIHWVNFDQKTDPI